MLYIGGWLDLRNGPQVLHVPEMAGRYYSVQFTDPSDREILPTSANVRLEQGSATTFSADPAGKEP